MSNIIDSFEKAYCHIITNNYEAAKRAFKGLIDEEGWSPCFFDGYVVSSILTGVDDFPGPGTNDKLYSIIIENLHICRTKKLDSFDSIMFIADAISVFGPDYDTSIYLRTAQLLRPKDYRVLTKKAEKHIKKRDWEKGCSLYSRAAKEWITTL